MEIYEKNIIISPVFKYTRFAITNFTPACFRKYLELSINEVMKEENRSFDFQVDNNNREFINDMFYYLNYDKKYSGDLDKGILLIGQIGCGKSFLMKAMFKIIELVCSKLVIQIPAKNLLNEIEVRGMDYFKKRPLYIDDLGKEEKEGKIYGTTHHPVEDLISFRDSYYSITFASGNYMMKTYEEYYTKHIIDRMGKMFNIHTLKGSSRR